MAEARSIVLFVHQSAELYGSDKMLLALVEGLRGSSFTPVVALPGPGPLVDALRALGIETHIAEVMKISRALYSPKGLIALPAAARRCLRELDAIVGGRDVRAVHSNTLAVLGGALWSRRRGAPHLWHVHEVIETPKAVARALPLLARCFADRVVANSNMTANWLRAAQPALARRSVVIHNGIAPAPGRPALARENLRARIGAPANALLVTLAGRINGGKGHEVLLAAAEILLREGAIAPFHFVLAGGPPPGKEYLRRELENAIAVSPAGTHFTLFPFIDDIWPLWFGSDIAVVPSTAPESFGLVAVEAMAAGLPVVASAQGGLVEIVRDGETGLLAPPGDAEALARALARLGRDAMLRERLGAAGSRYARDEFSLERHCEKFLSEYTALSTQSREVAYARR